MILLIDIGNTRIKWGVLKNNKVNYGGAFFYKNLPLEAAFAMNWAPLSMSRVAISNVGGKLIGDAVAGWLLKNKKIKAEFFFAEPECFGLRLGYTQPKTFGMDRFFAMLACWHNIQSAFVLLGCGSATTFDAVMSTGQHLGSLIAPGLYLQHTAIAQLANCAIPSEMSVQQQALGKSTAEAISQGTIQLISGFFNHQVHALAHQTEAAFRYVITGGDAESILPFLNFPCEYRPHIVLEGLAIYLKAQM